MMPYSGASAGSCASPLMKSLAFIAIICVGAFRLPLGIIGITVTTTNLSNIAPNNRTQRQHCFVRVYALTGATPLSD